MSGANELPGVLTVLLLWSVECLRSEISFSDLRKSANREEDFTALVERCILPRASSSVADGLLRVLAKRLVGYSDHA